MGDSAPWALIGVVGWLAGLSLATAVLGVKLKRLAREANEMQSGMLELGRRLDGVRQDLAGLARAQQVTDLRRQIVDDLRPVIADAAALAVGTRGRGRAGKQIGVEFAGAATVTGVVTGGSAGAVSSGDATTAALSDLRS